MSAIAFEDFSSHMKVDPRMTLRTRQVVRGLDAAEHVLRKENVTPFDIHGEGRELPRPKPLHIEAEVNWDIRSTLFFDHGVPFSKFRSLLLGSPHLCTEMGACLAPHQHRLHDMMERFTEDEGDDGDEGAQRERVDCLRNKTLDHLSFERLCRRRVSVSGT
jgi:hypothetical protein